MMITATIMMMITATITTTTDLVKPAKTTAVVLALILGVAACSSEPAATPASEQTSGGAAAVIEADAAGANNTTTDTQAAVDFEAVVEGLRGAYTFETRVELDGESVTDVNGRNIGGNSEFSLINGGSELDIINVGADIWSRAPGGEWAPQAGVLSNADPLAPLLDSTGRTVNGELITVVYPGAAFGIDAETVEVKVRVDGDAIELNYQDNGVTVRTRLAPTAVEPAIVAPA